MLDFHVPSDKNMYGVRYALPFRLPEYWWPRDAAVAPVDGFRSGSIGTSPNARTPIEVEFQALGGSSTPAAYAVAYLKVPSQSPIFKPPGPHPDRFSTDIELVPGSASAETGDQLALIYALPSCADCADDTATLHLRGPAHGPAPTWQVVGLDTEPVPQKTTAIAVEPDPKNPGAFIVRIPSHGRGLIGETGSVSALFIRAEFPARTFPVTAPENSGGEAGLDAGTHEVAVHTDGTLTVNSTVQLAKPIEHGWLMAPVAIDPFTRSWNPLHPAKQLYSALHFDVERNETGPEALEYTLHYRSIGQWIDDPDDDRSGHSRLIFPPPGLNGELSTAETVRFQFDDPSWIPHLRVEAEQDC